MGDAPFHAAEVEHDCGALIMPNGSVLMVPKTEAGTEWAMACARAAVDARREWHRPLPGRTIDGRYTQITEVGDTTGQEADEGGALKNAASDALKRAAMRLGLGLSLWARDGYFLFDQLTKSEGGGRPEPTSAEGAESDPGSASPSDATLELDLCQECGRDQLPLAEIGGHAPTCSRRPL